MPAIARERPVPEYASACEAAKPDHSNIRHALERVLRADSFAGSERLAAFLSYIVERSLAGEAGKIKGYTVAVEALGYPTDHDPHVDSTVRVLAGRLRQALTLYYACEGAQDPVKIEVPKGCYVPRFIRRAADNQVAMAHTGDDGLRSAVPLEDILARRRRVFDHIATMAVQLTEAASAIIALRDGDSMIVLGRQGMTLESYSARYRLGESFDTSLPLIVIDNVAEDPRLEGHPLRDLHPLVRRVIVVPIRFGERCRGALSVLDPAPETEVDGKCATSLCSLSSLVSMEFQTFEMFLADPVGSTALRRP